MNILVCFVCTLLLIVAVHSFHLSDHGDITALAMKEYSTCFPKTRLSGMMSDIIKGNYDEDANLWNKWIKGYAHFYNPYHQVKVCNFGFCRSSTDVRLRILETNLLNKTGNWGNTVGAVTHHLQDMNSPPHVVPVMHDQKDGFESYANNGYPTFNPDCNFTQLYTAIASGTKDFLFAMLNRTSIATLDSLSAPVSYSQNGTLTQGPWSTLFWQNSHVDTNNFGTYGSLGNNFGHTKFLASGRSITISGSIYEGYKLARIRAAVDATKLAFLYADKLNPES